MKGERLTAKKPMSARKMLTLTTLASDESAAFRTASRFLMHWAVLSWIVPSIRAPVLSEGIWPEQKMAKGVLMAWDCGRGRYR